MIKLVSKEIAKKKQNDGHCTVSIVGYVDESSNPGEGSAYVTAAIRRLQTQLKLGWLPISFERGSGSHKWTEIFLLKVPEITELPKEEPYF